jgi:hypothetical protein
LCKRGKRTFNSSGSIVAGLLCSRAKSLDIVIGFKTIRAVEEVSKWEFGVIGYAVTDATPLSPQACHILLSVPYIDYPEVYQRNGILERCYPSEALMDLTMRVSSREIGIFTSYKMAEV